MPMRVKTAWIDALTASRENAKAAKDGSPVPPKVKPDLTPKKMSDSYYSAVCFFEMFKGEFFADFLGVDFAVGSR
jgi:hypothetical protein